MSHHTNYQIKKISKDINRNIEKFLISEGFDPSKLKGYYSTSWDRDDEFECITLYAYIEVNKDRSQKLAELLTEVIEKYYHPNYVCDFYVMEPGVLYCDIEEEFLCV